MITHIRGGGRLLLKAFALFVGFSLLSCLSAMANDDGPALPTQVPKGPQPYTGIHLFHDPPSFGTLGYGPPGLHPGLQGFGLGYHLGYGYGGNALGVGAEGGYPFYGGPGYPCYQPRLRRIGGIVPFPYFGGTGYPTPDHPNYFGRFGPLVPDRPVVTIVTGRGEPVQGTDYGNFTGGVPNAEALFAPFTARASATGAGPPRPIMSAPPPPGAELVPPRPSTTPPTGVRANVPRARKLLGIEAEPVAEADGVRGMKVTKVYPGSQAERTGLHQGDVIHSINNYLTQQYGNLEWIFVNAAPNKILKISVRSASDNQEHTFTVLIP